MGPVYHGGLLGRQHEGVIVARHGPAKAAIASLCLLRPADPPGKDVSLQGNGKLLEVIGFLGKQRGCWDRVCSPDEMHWTGLCSFDKYMEMTV